MNNQTNVEPLSTACTRDLGDPDLWIQPDGYRESLALCIIDSIYSTGAHYSQVVNIVRRYRAYRSARGGDADSDGMPQLLRTMNELGGVQTWSEQIGNRRPTSTHPGAPLKAEAIRQVAESLQSLDLRTTADVRAAAADDGLAAAKQAWTSAPGQRSGLTWEYALMLAGVPGVKADRMVSRYVARAINQVEVTANEAADLVRAVAERHEWDVIRTDHAIWRFESGRPVNRDGDPAE